MGCYRRLALFGWAVAWAGVSVGASNQPQEQVIGSVEVRGTVTISENFVRSVIRTAAGDTLDRAVLDDDVRRLLQTGRFLTASADTVTRDGELVVVFEVAERPTVSSVRVVGNLKIKDKVLLELVPLTEGDSVDAFSVREGSDNIEGAYREKGYSNVTVSHDAELLSTTGELVYTIEEGPRRRIRRIRFEGNASFPVGELNKRIVSKTHFWVFRDGNFDSDQAEQDAAAVQQFYRGEGYLDARASYRVEPGDKPDDLVLVFTIVEGDLYQVESVSVQGAAVFTAEDVLGRMRTEVGQVIKQDALDRDVRDIQTRYGDIGHIYAQVRAVRVFSEQPGLVLVRVEIDEGEQFRVRRIVVRGNETTKDKVVRRALNLFPPDDLINLSELRDAEQRLRETQIFGFAKINPVGNQPGVRDLVIDVEESERAGDFIVGFGVNSNSGAVGSIVLDIKNFDLFDWPRSFEEFVKLRSFRGAGQRLRIEAQPGTQFNRFRIDFTEPYFLEMPIRFGTSVYFFDRGRDDFNERRIGGNVSFGKRIKRGRLKDWYGEVALRVEEVDVDEVELFSGEDIRDIEGSNFLTSAKFTLVRDRTDSRFVPTNGDLFRVSWEQFGVLGGDWLFGKIRASYTWHKTLFVDEEDRPHVVSLRGDVGAVVGESPTFERFYAGGIGSIRGFEFRGVTPRQGLKDSAVGGDFMALARAEYSFPFYGDNLRGVFFTDMGTVEEDFELTQWRATVGFGIRMTIEFFGPVPLEFDLAAPLLSNADDEEQPFSFFIGATF